MKFTKQDHFNVGWLYGKRKMWCRRAVFKRRDAMLAWKPSPASMDAKFLIITFGSTGTLGHIVDTLKIRKDWSRRERGFLLRTHLRVKP